MYTADDGDEISGMLLFFSLIETSSNIHPKMVSILCSDISDKLSISVVVHNWRSGIQESHCSISQLGSFYLTHLFIVEKVFVCEAIVIRYVNISKNYYLHYIK